MTDKKLQGMLGLSRRAGKLFAGYDLSVEKIRAGDAKLALAASDISEKTYKNLCYEAVRKEIPVSRLSIDKDTLGKSCGIKAGVIVITDEGFAEAAVKMDGVVDIKEEI